ncbi:C-terminal-binding protein-like [Corticium candelabrum]|uniref:C-terminal-binding protein-like n=1 Tax=Corticium candelabrum TaxID=121492 RepID=UPI002E257960|nr:C-terminal-binding protein-like [Corticium candelabrum]
MALPLVVVLGSENVSVEQDILDSIATVIGTDPHQTRHVPDEIASRVSAVSAWHTARVDRELLERMKNCKIVVRCGAGYDNVDAQAAGQLGIAVSNAPAYGTEEVADSAMCLILNLHRRTLHLERCLREGKMGDGGVECQLREATGARRIRGKVLGLVGLGRIGTAVALRAKPFGFDIVCYDPFLLEGIEKAVGVRRVYCLEELLSQSDCVSLHCYLNDDNRHMINEKTLGYMKPGAFIVNTARGGLIDENALAEALKSGHVAAAALDVQEKEPFDSKSSSLGQAPNVICTPHVAWYSDCAWPDCRKFTAEEIGRGLVGTSPFTSGLRSWVNKESYEDQGRWTC